MVDEKLRQASRWPVGPGKPPWPTVTGGYELRIEALRAASRVVATAEGREHISIKARTDFTVGMAEQFARWLETGER